MSIDQKEREANSKLSTAVWDSRKRLEPFQRQMLKLVKEFVGRDYGVENATDVDRQPLNQLALAVITYQHRLMSDNPRVLVTTDKPELAEHALEREAILNKWIIATKAKDQFVQAVIAAMFGFGIIKVGVCLDRARSWQDPGEVRIWAVGIDDYVRDMLAKSRQDMSFEGMRYRVPTSRLLADNSISEEDKKRINPTPRNAYNEFGNQKIESLSEGIKYPIEMQDYTDLWEIWLPELQMIKTFLGTYGSSLFDPVPIKQVKWEGPTNGPYHELAYHPVLDNIIPKPPVSLYSDLNWAMNIIVNKVIRQGIGQKKLLLYDKLAQGADIEAINNAKDGHAVAVNNPQASVERSLGGPDQLNQALVVQLRNLFSLQAGNIDQLGGLQSQAPTAHQEELLAQSSSLSLNSMQSSVMSCLNEVMTDVAFWLFKDPSLNMSAQKPIGDTGHSMNFTMNSDTIKGNPDDFFYENTPYSHVFKTPTDRWQTITGILQEILPLAQAAQSGAPIDVDAVLALAARYNDCPEIKTIWMSPPQDPGAGAASQDNPSQGAQNAPPPIAPAGGNVSTYVRKDRGTDSPSQRDSAMLSMLSKAAPSQNGAQQ